MKFLHIIIIVLVLINIYLVYKTSYIEKLSAEIPSIEHFESTTITSRVNDQYILDMNDIKFLSNFAQRIIQEDDTLNFRANKVIFKDAKITDNLQLSGNLVVGGSVQFTNSATVYADIIPRYMICLWGGILSNIPKGWAICDGSRYKLADDGTAQVHTEGYLTPDLKGRFVLSSGIATNDNGPMTERIFRATGGVEKVTLTENQIPAHSHYMNSGHVSSRMYGTSWAYFPISWLTGKGRIGWFTADAGGGQPHNNMPPYTVLIYIMKI